MKEYKIAILILIFNLLAMSIFLIDCSTFNVCDVNKDKIVDDEDFKIVQNFILVDEKNKKYYENYDINKDKKIDILDLQMIQKEIIKENKK